ncbi:hypothetical protein POM88_040240 [Heracleum sosnowskyi]|uniref:Uncharacterized protein n=1 Tax=Heracleum sosnowskyi TaxID=360622 RepID=A0AAD8HE63_9APIA|nr:hypothetical protein POM88_040240 [Heracleum sosnowskyi]
MKITDLSGESFKEINREDVATEEKRYNDNKEKMPATEFYEANSINSEKDIFPTDQPSQSSTIKESNTGSKKVVAPFPENNNLEQNKERVDEYIQANALLQEKDYTSSSPYHKGLTDFTLDISKEKITTIEIDEAILGAQCHKQSIYLDKEGHQILYKKEGPIRFDRSRPRGI